MTDMLNAAWFEDLKPDDAEGSNIDLGDVGRLSSGGGGGNLGNSGGDGGDDD